MATSSTMLSITGATIFQTSWLKNEKFCFGAKPSQLAMNQKSKKLNCHQNFSVSATYRDDFGGGGGDFFAGFVLGEADFGTLAYAFAPQHKSSFSSLSNSSLTKRRGQVLIPKAGPPNTTTLILAFVFPFSLFAGTVFASIRIADKLDEQFLEDLAINRAIMEEEEEEEEEGERVEDGDGVTFREEEVAAAAAAAAADAPRVRNRPRKEV